MRTKLFTIFFLAFSAFPIFASEVWETVEDIVVNNITATKRVLASDNMARTINTTENGENETIIDLAADKITLINHKNKSYQVLKLSEYIKFAEQLAEELKSRGQIDQSKVAPKVTFASQGSETVGRWNCEVWAVSVDGKPYSRVWVAAELKDSPFIAFRKKFSAVFPESIAKYRNIESVIESNFFDKGMIVKTVKAAASNRMPSVTNTLVSLKRSDLKAITFKIPEGYQNKSAGATEETTKQK